MEDLTLGSQSINPNQLYISKVEDTNRINCPLCKNIPRQFEFCCKFCNILYCENCFEHNNLSTCLACNKPLMKGEYPDIDKLLLNCSMFECKYKKDGCAEIVEYDKLTAHESNCIHIPVEAPPEEKLIEVSKSALDRSTIVVNAKEESVIQDMHVCGECGFEQCFKDHKNTEALIKHIQHRLLESFKQNFDEMKGDFKSYCEALLSNKGSAVNTVASEASIEKASSIKLYKDITSTADNNYDIDDRFTVVHTFDGCCLIIYSNEKYGLDIYDVDLDKVIKMIPNVHSSNIISIRSFSDAARQKSYLLTTSFDRSIKVHHIEDKLTQIIHIKDSHKDYSIFSGLIIFGESEAKNQIVTSNYSEGKISIWNFEGAKVRDFKVPKVTHMSLFKLEDKQYLLICSNTILKSYNFETGVEYIEYAKSSNEKYLSSYIIDDSKAVVFSSGGFIRVINLKSDGFLLEIPIPNISSICVWNKSIVFAGCRDCSIKLVDLDNGSIFKVYNSQHSGAIVTLKFFQSNKFGHCLATYGSDSKIKLWTSQ